MAAHPGNPGSDTVHRALAERLACAAAGALAVKGFAEPVRAWRLLGLREAAELGDRPFVGRRSELQRFRALLEACQEVGHGQAVYVRGEAGIGKTRLVEEFQAAARRAGFVCHTGLVLDFGAGTGQDAIRSLVRSLLPPRGRRRGPGRQGVGMGRTPGAGLRFAPSKSAFSKSEPERSARRLLTVHLAGTHRCRRALRRGLREAS